jgi:hypothetical protein
MTSSVTGPRSSRSGGHIAAIVTGTVVLAIAAAALLGGGVVIAADTTQRDSDGYYASGVEKLTTPTHALVSNGLDVGTAGPDWLFRQARLGTVRVTASGTASRPIFVGIARKPLVDRYLRGVGHDEITDFEVDPLSVTTVRRPGVAAAAAPAAESFWARSASGSGRQTMTWPVQKGAWAVVIMNADGSRGVSSGVSVGAKLGFMRSLGIGLLIVGVILAAGGAVAIVMGMRRPRPPASATGTATQLTTTT